MARTEPACRPGTAAPDQTWRQRDASQPPSLGLLDQQDGALNILALGPGQLAPAKSSSKGEAGDEPIGSGIEDTKCTSSGPRPVRRPLLNARQQPVRHQRPRPRGGSVKLGGGLAGRVLG